MARSQVLVTVTGPVRAKKMLRERADTSLSATGLDAILYLLGISAEELQDATARFG